MDLKNLYLNLYDLIADSNHAFLESYFDWRPITAVGQFERDYVVVLKACKTWTPITRGLLDKGEQSDHQKVYWFCFSRLLIRSGSPLNPPIKPFR